MTHIAPPGDIVTFDSRTRALVRLSARIAGGTELDVRAGLRETRDALVNPIWVEELLLQSYLFCGFPRVINAILLIREGEAKQGVTRGEGEGRQGGIEDWRRLGEATCARVYGRSYQKLRENISALHPDLEEWMIVEGYGKVLSRPGLDLGRRELCIVAACVASAQERQLHSHLIGARNVGVDQEVISAALSGLDGVVETAPLERANALWRRITSDTSQT